MMRAYFAKAGQWFAIAIGFSVPISTAADNILLYLALSCLMLTGGWREKWEWLRRNPVAWAGLLLLFALSIGGLYGPGDWRDALHYWRKYVPLAALPLLLLLFRDEDTRRHALNGFLSAMALTLAFSYVIATGWFADRHWFQGVPGNAFVFKLHITQNVFMAFFAYALAIRAAAAQVPWRRWAWAVAALLAAYNVLFMVQGRTGYVVLFVLSVYLGFQHLRWKGLLLAALLCAGVMTAGYFGSPVLRQRVDLLIRETAAWHPGQGAATSSGLRMDFWINTLHIIRDHPLLGVGVGGFAKAYGEKVAGTAMQPTTNPHNQFLLIGAQLGVIGLGLLLHLFYRQWRCAECLPDESARALAHGLVLTFMAGGLMNSLLLDHAESLFFAWLSAVLYADFRQSPTDGIRS